jgi:hypothetical protein
MRVPTDEEEVEEGTIKETYFGGHRPQNIDHDQFLKCQWQEQCG